MSCLLTNPNPSFHLEIYAFTRQAMTYNLLSLSDQSSDFHSGLPFLECLNALLGKEVTNMSFTEQYVYRTVRGRTVCFLHILNYLW